MWAVDVDTACVVDTGRFAPHVVLDACVGGGAPCFFFGFSKFDF